jgi:hypothetical protein
MYRNEGLANALHIDALRDDVAALSARLAEAERARERALAQLERIRDGVEVDPALETEPSYRRLLGGLRVVGALAALALAIGLVPLLAHLVEAPLLTARGVANLVFHVTRGHGLVGLGAAGFVVMVASPWLALPLLAARGLVRHRRSGWTLGVIACALYLPTPLLPLAVYGLVLLYSSRVRRAYLAT